MFLSRTSFASALATLLAVAVVSPLSAAKIDTAKLPPAAPQPVDFLKGVRPLLERSCVKCHGAEKQKGDLRLDAKSHALTGGSLGAAIVPGKSAESLLIISISGLDEDLVMPEKGEKLTAAEVGVLRRWIDDGATWVDTQPVVDVRQTHWSFQPVRHTPGATLDSFITAKLAEKGLRLSPPADARMLCRRLYFDLIGLPPESREIDAFVQAMAKDADRAVRDLVDHLLASPRYGERWARHWLDVVRFAESDGFETNQPRPNAWPYRDYVIKSFNEDKPYDQFIREQLAGDALGVDEATGFLVGGPWDRVKSPDPVLTANQRADELHDMVGATGATFLGLTVNCARCHQHKFDPITHADYYAMKAVFAGVQHGERTMQPPDAAAREKRLLAVRAELAPLETRMSQWQPLARTTRVLVLDDTQPSNGGDASVEELEKPRGVAPHAAGNGRGYAQQPGSLRSLPNLGQGYHWWDGISDRPVFAYTPRLAGRWRVWLSWGAGWPTHSLDTVYVLDADGDPATTGDQREIARVDQRQFADGSGEPFAKAPLWSGLRDAGVQEFTPTTRLLVKAGSAGRPVTADTVVFEEAGASASSPAAPHLRAQVTRGENVERLAPVDARWVRFTIHATTDVEPCLDELEVWNEGGQNVAREAKLASSGDYQGNPFHRLAHLNDGRYGNEHSWISNEKGKGWVQLEFPRPERVTRITWSRDRSPAPKYEDRTPTRYEVAVSMDGQSWRTVAGDFDRLPKKYPHPVSTIRINAGLSPNEAVEAELLEQRYRVLRAEAAALAEKPMVYAGRLTAPEKTMRFHRGDPLQPREEIAPAGLSAFAPFGLKVDAPEQARRLALANWIASPQHPLTARVLVNRLWHYHFGTGLADTPSDLGVNGGRPSHPELLDWLAGEFIERGWSVKAMHRLICNSATYRQSSHPREDGREADASNRLWWRFPSRRLEAEALRDTMLAVSGRLDLRMGGPGFDLFEPNTNYVKVYASKNKFGPGDFRRMVYQNKPRAELDTLFGAFDCPDAGQAQPKRNVSTTPLQALNLLHSEFVLGQAAEFTARLEREAPRDPSAQVRRAFALAFSRDATEPEIAAAVALIHAHGLPAFCRALYNANEFLTIY